MKLLKPALITVFFLTLAIAANAQSGKIAIINTQAFSDQKIGITRLAAMYKKVEDEFKPRHDEIKTLMTRYEQLKKEITDTKALADQKTITAKIDQAEKLERDIKFKREDGQAAMEKRFAELSNPVFTDIQTALKTFAKQKGIDVILDIGRDNSGSIFLMNEAADITRVFITEYNKINP